MNWNRTVLLFLASVFMMGVLSSCAGDPRKNCNHPQHGAYMREVNKKKHGF